MKTPIAEMVADALEIEIDISDRQSEETDATSTATERNEAALRFAISTDVLALIAKHGLIEVLESIQFAAEQAADVHEGSPYVRGLRAFAVHMGSAGTLAALAAGDFATSTSRVKR